jgi:hypothetical protein
MESHSKTKHKNIFTQIFTTGTMKENKIYMRRGRNVMFNTIYMNETVILIQQGTSA